jgi:hypothetical protein
MALHGRTQSGGVDTTCFTVAWLNFPLIYTAHACRVHTREQAHLLFEERLRSLGKTRTLEWDTHTPCLLSIMRIHPWRLLQLCHLHWWSFASLHTQVPYSAFGQDEDGEDDVSTSRSRLRDVQNDVDEVRASVRPIRVWLAGWPPLLFLLKSP